MMGDCGAKKAGCSAGPATYEQGKTGHRCESVATVTVKLWVHDPTIRVKDKGRTTALSLRRADFDFFGNLLTQ